MGSDYFEDSEWMRGRYLVMNKLGEGGFGKVRMALHTATNDSVAIKEMSKEKLGPDIVHIRQEVEAMKNLTHQNICRLLQFVETKTHFYLVLEHCNGGEMFDYIVQRNKLTEPEARHFFRQLVQAISFCHSQGYAHRDLKPENLLLKDDLRLKVIDFGLSSRTGRLLSTYCGSLAYAAPEVLANRPYDGKASDIWSMGVLLYILITGCSPFQLDNHEAVVRNIKSGVFKIPSFVTPQCADLLRRMMTVNPSARITMPEVLVHPWIKQGYTHGLKTNSIYNKDVVDEDIIRELANFEDVSVEKMSEHIKKWKYDYMTATYLLLLQRKERKESISLPSYKKKSTNVVNSPTIHASLDSGLDAKPTASDEEPFNRSPLNIDRNCGSNKENIPGSFDKYYPSTTPKRPPKPPPFVTPKRTGSLPRRCRDPMTPTSERSVSPCQSPKSHREPRSSAKSPRLGRRLFASLERMKAPRVFDMITPRRNQPDRLKTCTNYANVSVTYSDDPQPIRDRLAEVLQQLNLKVKTSGWKVSGTDDQRGVTVEMEVVWIEEMKKIGVKRKRLTGDAFVYKKVCEEVLKMAKLADPVQVPKIVQSVV
ncbi:unnamed protein product [Bursaphelenchus xylophilus]|uniref:non-specific serine/threonine protein kinase n=1 Tax=Bursaphelenchus xylophilus TaxID=6326 RepID=A0A1I7RHG6_BURXY|nr:unnamed protein product [Bursaphelenchus xylophilus]CAG9115770.1 unnamed protein product [Bursaphelenchus xylophilus]